MLAVFVDLGQEPPNSPPEKPRSEIWAVVGRYPLAHVVAASFAWPEVNDRSSSGGSPYRG